MSLDLDGIYKEIDDICYDIIDERTDKGLERLKELTPEDTFDLQERNQRSEVDKVAEIYMTRIFNDSPYAEYVEKSIQPKNYYKGGGRKSGGKPFLQNSKGANMFLKTEDYIDNL